jgi:hypothetical protein
VSYWIKSVYNTDARWCADEWQSLTWISDHHRFRKNGEPSHRPGYRVGDELVVYDATNRACPARLRVTAEADYQPGRVSREAGRGEGRRWGWLTEVELLAAVDRDRAPTLLEIYVQPKSMRQQDHMTLEQTQYERARVRIPDGLGGGQRLTSRPLPVEQGTAESFVQRFEEGRKSVYRAEEQLVRAYADYLRRRGYSVGRHQLWPPGEAPVASDLFEYDRKNLIEAKALPRRAAIRMAIGQLADYARLMTEPVNRRAVLLPERPSKDLEALLASQDIGAVWRRGRGFDDNVGGALT